MSFGFTHAHNCVERARIFHASEFVNHVWVFLSTWSHPSFYFSLPYSVLSVWPWPQNPKCKSLILTPEIRNLRISYPEPEVNLSSGVSELQYIMALLVLGLFRSIYSKIKPSKSQIFLLPGFHPVSLLELKLAPYKDRVICNWFTYSSCLGWQIKQVAHVCSRMNQTDLHLTQTSHRVGALWMHWLQWNQRICSVLRIYKFTFIQPIKSMYLRVLF